MELYRWEGLSFSQKLNGFFPNRFSFVSSIQNILLDCDTILISKLLDFLLEKICILFRISSKIINIPSNLLRSARYFCYLRSIFSAWSSLVAAHGMENRKQEYYNILQLLQFKYLLPFTFMQWNNFVCTSPPQTKFLLQDNTNSRKSKSRTKQVLSNNKHTFSNRNIITLPKQKSPFEKQLDSSISALFVQQMNKEDVKTQCIKEMRDALLQIRDYQKQQAEYSKKMFKILDDKSMKKQKSTVKKKKSYNFGLENHVNTKFKQFDKLKNDLTMMLRKSRSSQKTHKKSHSIIRILK